MPYVGHLVRRNMMGFDGVEKSMGENYVEYS
jgi:hypothetical protein